MKKYVYFPGCSAHGTGKAYDESIRAVATLLGIELEELDDWNCCGATAYMGVNELVTFCLTARNLALAKKQEGDLVTPCSACYANCRKTESYLREYPELSAKVQSALAEGGLAYHGGVTSKHFLEVVVRDVGLDRVRELVRRPLTGLRAAPYYGCQIVRPLGIDDDPDEPVMLDQLLQALGATPTRYPMKTLCCGASLMGTQPEVALRLCRNLLLCAREFGADCIAVTCPLCQTNLDVYQGRVNSIYDADFRIPVLYFTQLMGIALGAPPDEIGLGRGIVPLGRVLEPREVAP
jgi:heterodisulfide reductase subunit B